MDSIFTLLCIAAGGFYLYHCGKRLGSRKAFRVGFNRARRRFVRRQGRRPEKSMK